MRASNVSGPVEGALPDPSPAAEGATTRSMVRSGKRTLERPDGLADRSSTKRQKSSGTHSRPRASVGRLTDLHGLKTETPETGTRVVFAGGGPRTSAQVSQEVEFLFNHADDFKRILQAGGRYNIQSVIAEKQDEAFLGRGNAWGPNQGGGTVNTGAETSGVDYRQRLIDYETAHRGELQQRYGAENPVAGATLRRAFDGNDAPGDGKPTTKRGVMTRQDQGLEEHLHLMSQLDRAREAFPFYTVKVLTNTSAEALDLSRPDKPNVTFVDAKSKETLGTITADVVRLNTGTTPGSPISDPEVKKHSFIQPMDPVALNAFLQEKNLLDDSGKLKEGVKLALGGTSLSAYDQMIVLQSAMGLVERDDTTPSGYRVTQQAKEKYAGALTFISNTPGKWAPPRHSLEPVWTQKTEGLGTSAELHAAFLHGNGEKVFSDWNDILLASIALAVEKTPNQIGEKGLTTEGLLDAQHQRNVLHAKLLDEAVGLTGEAKAKKIDEAMQTLEGARRQAVFQSALGLAMERHPEQAEKAMSDAAPMSFSGRMGYQMLRAQVSGITQVEDDVAPDNKKLLTTQGTWMSDITSSPMQVQEMASMMFEAGVATYMPGSYTHLVASQEHGKPLTFTGMNDQRVGFDAFIVSPTFSRRGEPLLASLAGQVEPVHSSVPDLGQVGKNRQIVARGGEPSHVEDYSLNGKGAYVGRNSSVGQFAWDTNNRESAGSVAVGLAFRRMAAEHLAAAGVPNAVAEVDKLYASQAPINEKAFAEEVGKFEKPFDSMTTKAAFFRSAAEATPNNPKAFAQLAEQGRSGARVASQAALLEPAIAPVLASWAQKASTPEEMETADRFRAPAAAFGEAMLQAEKFNPPSQAKYEKRFVDVTVQVHQAVYNQALEKALSILQDGSGAGAAGASSSRGG